MTVRPFSQQILRMTGAGTEPDPAVFCPIHGFVDETQVIPKPFLPSDGWQLLCEFQNNSPNTTTFDPTITATSGTFGWDLGDGTYLIGDKAVSHTYLTTATRTVKLYGKGTFAIDVIDFSNDHIIGNINLSHTAFSTVRYWELFSNLGITMVLFPSSVTAAIKQINLYRCNLSGTLNLSMFNNHQNQSFINLSENINLTNITWFSSLTSTSGISQLNLNTTGLTGIINLSTLTRWSGNSTISIYSCPNVTGFIWPSVPMFNYVQTFNINRNASMTSLDLSSFSSVLYTNIDFNIFSNPSLSNLILPSLGTKTVNTLNLYLNPILPNISQLVNFTNFSTFATIDFHGNSSMTLFTFANSISGTINVLDFSNCNITGILDLSKFKTFSISASIKLNNNLNLSGILWSPTPITGIIKTLYSFANTSLGYVNYSNLGNPAISYISWDIQNNNWSASIVNHVLSDLNVILQSGFTNRLITIGGSNADPDSTSGGYDGIAARNALIAKGFTVTIT